MTTVCLAVMAKNEAHVIARCLASAKGLADTWLLLDTGSTDATADVAREAMRGMPGEVVSRPWRGFDQSRSELLALARDRADYTLMIDADDVIEAPPGARFPALTQPGYALTIVDGPIQYQRMQVFASAAPWRFEGVLHEFAVCDAPTVPARIDGIVYRRVGGGARSQDPDKYLNDAELLEAELKRDPSNARNVFEVGHTYEDAGNAARALAQYERRAVMGGWPEEVYSAVFNAARMRETIGFPRDRIESGYLEAWNLRPHRAEPLFRLAVVAREAGDYARARAFATTAQAIPLPRDEVLPVSHEVYGWRALDELAAACAALSDFAAAVAVCRAMLARPLPPGDRARIEGNLASCDLALGGARTK